MPICEAFKELLEQEGCDPDKIIEFVDQEIENLQKKVAEKYGYDLVDHKLELYGVKKKS